MDRAKEKRLQNIRVIMTNIFMSVSVIAIVFILMLIAMGFSFNESGELEQSGLVQLVSSPSDASIVIDGNSQFGHTEFSKMLTSGSHQISITKNGYDTWAKDINIDAGLLTRIEWIRLFPTNPEISNAISFSNLRLASFSANHKRLIVVEKNKNELIDVTLNTDKVKHNTLKLSDCLNTSEESITDGNITIISWNENNTKFIAKWTKDDKTSWHYVDLEHPEKSINLNKKFNFDFDSVLIANDSASKLWVLEKQNLHLVDISSRTISGTLANNIHKIANYRDIVAFINTEEKTITTDAGESKKITEYRLNTYRDGEQSYVSIATLDKIQQESTIKLGMGTYWNEGWIAYSIDKHATVMAGKYPSYGKDKDSTMKSVFDTDLSFQPNYISVNNNHRIIVIAGTNSALSFDIETKDDYTFDYENQIADINWLDDYILWQNVDNTIVIRDFDGSNRRTIIDNIDNNLPVAISDGGHSLYYFNVSEQNSASTDNNPSDADPSTNTQTTITYTLKRMKLF